MLNREWYQNCVVQTSIQRMMGFVLAVILIVCDILGGKSFAQKLSWKADKSNLIRSHKSSSCARQILLTKFSILAATLIRDLLERPPDLKKEEKIGGNLTTKIGKKMQNKKFTFEILVSHVVKNLTRNSCYYTAVQKQFADKLHPSDGGWGNMLCSKTPKQHRMQKLFHAGRFLEFKI